MTTAFLRLISLGLSLQGISGFSASVVRSGNSRISSCSAQESSARSSLSVSPFSTAASSIRKFRSHSTSCTRRYVAPDTESTRKSRENVSVQSEGGLGSVALSSTKNGDSITQEEDVKGALKRTLLWVGLAAVFGTGLFFAVSPQVSEEFFAGYLLEQSLSVDNLLVFLLLFEYFQVPKAYQNRVLNWGIFGAIVMRATMIGAGAIALQQFHAVLLVFAGILIYSSAKVLLGGEEEEEEDFSENMVVQFSNKFIQSTSQFDGDRFFTEVDGVRLATPMFLCMVAVELSDVVFAVDSIPAVFGVTEVSEDVALHESFLFG